MIDHAAARAGLAAILADQIDATVQPAGINALATFPTVIIGQPSWTEDDRLPYALTRSVFPVACVVAQSNTAGDSAVINQLEGLWPRVLQLLRSAGEQDQTLGGICSEVLIKRADYGRFSIQGKDYPAQLIFVELYG